MIESGLELAEMGSGSKLSILIVLVTTLLIGHVSIGCKKMKFVKKTHESCMPVQLNLELNGLQVVREPMLSGNLRKLKI